MPLAFERSFLDPYVVQCYLNGAAKLEIQCSEVYEVIKERKTRLVKIFKCLRIPTAGFLNASRSMGYRYIQNFPGIGMFSIWGFRL